MNPIIKYVVAVILTLFICWVFIFGTYSIFTKAGMYISAVRTTKQIKSIGDFLGNFDPALEYQAPAGQDEIAANYLGIIYNVIGEQSNPEVIKMLIGEAEKWGLPIVARDRGFNFNSILFNMGSVYEAAAVKLNDKNYYQRALALFEYGNKLSPQKQVFMESLLDLYKMGGDKVSAINMANQILSFWPDDGKAREVINSK